MNSKELIVELIRDYMRDTAAGHQLSNIHGDVIWSTPNPINLTVLAKEIERAKK